MSSEAVAVVIIVALVILAFVLFAVWDGGERYIISCLLKEGYSVVTDESVPAGEGRYAVRIWRDSGWVIVER